MSYTQFEYSDISIDKKEIYDNETVSISVKVKNTGKMTGKEIVQLYVKDMESSVRRPHKELKGFEKLELLPGEEKLVRITLDKRAFAYYNEEIKDWYVESGNFEILIGKSSKEIVLREIVKVNSSTKIVRKYTRNSTAGDIMTNSYGASLLKPMLKGYAKKIGIDIEQVKEGSTDIVTAMIKYMPLRVLPFFSEGLFSEEMLDELLRKVNDAH